MVRFGRDGTFLDVWVGIMGATAAVENVKGIIVCIRDQCAVSSDKT